MSSQDHPELFGRRTRTPRAAAIAGILFALLLGTAFVMLRLAVPTDPEAPGEWVSGNAGTVSFALSLIPFAGIAFLWFIGVIRNRLGQFEDRFFDSVLFGSGLLFLALVFVSAAIAVSLVSTYGAQGEQMVESGLYGFGREVMFRVTNTYAIRMAAVFMLSLGTIWFRTRSTNRWLVVLTYASALVLLFTLEKNLWVVLLFPAWVMVVSVYILVTSLRSETEVSATSAGAVVDRAEK